MNEREEKCPTRASACIIVVHEPDLVLAIYNDRHRCWGLPGGKREPGDRDIRATARRELHEETNILAGRLIWLGAGEYQPIETSQLDFLEVHLYYAWSVEGSPATKETTLAWMQWDWLVKEAPAFRSFYRAALPDGVSHLRVTTQVRT
jgi:8-oxo-dGTP pyrophosphatase MutT (NUDIX family)